MAKKTHLWTGQRGQAATLCGLKGRDTENLVTDIRLVTCKNCLRAAEDDFVTKEVPIVPIVPITPGKVPSRFDEDTHKDEVLAPTGSWVERDETSS